MTGMKSPIFLRLGKRLRGNIPATPGEICDINFSNITAVDSHFPIVLSGLSEKKAERITLNNIHVEYNYTVTGDLATLNEESNNENRTPGTTDITKIPEMETSYPDIRMFGDPLPVWGIFARHLADLRFSNVQLFLKKPDVRPPNLFLDTSRVSFDGVQFHSP